MKHELIKRDVNVASARQLGLPIGGFRAMHEIILPQRLRRGVSDQIAWDVANAAPIAFKTLEGDAYTYVAESGRVRIVRGITEDAGLVIELSSDNWDNYYYEMRTNYGLLYAEAVRFLRGKFAMWDSWEPALRCLYSGTPIYNPATLDLRDLDGAKLDIHRSFLPDDDPAHMAHFLHTTGYLHIRSAFSKEEMARISEELDQVRGAAVEGEVFSRWGTDDQGRKTVFDLHYLTLKSRLMKDLDNHAMVRFLTGLAGEHVVPSEDRDCGTHAITREFSGNSDSFGVLGWHQDCGLGGCPVTCPRVHVGIQVDAANADSSKLYFLAGSASRSCHLNISPEQARNLPIAAFDTQPGDATVHLGCILHAANTAQGRNRRRTIYTRFVNPMALDIFDPFGSVDQVIPGISGDQSMPSPADMAALVEAR